MSYDFWPWGRAIPYTSPITGRSTTLYNIGTVADAIGRTSQTLRKWEIGGVIPPTPFKQRGKRLYSKEHMDLIIACAEKSRIRQGSKYTQKVFSDLLYKDFQAVNDLFFKKVEEE